MTPSETLPVTLRGVTDTSPVEAYGSVARLLILDLLFVESPLSTTQIATMIPEAAGAIEVHMTALSTAGLVEGDDSAWMATDRPVYVDEDEDDLDALAAEDSMQHHRARLSRGWIDGRRSPAWANWSGAAISRSGSVRTTPEKLAQFNDRMNELFRDLEDQDGEPQWISIEAFPLRGALGLDPQ